MPTIEISKKDLLNLIKKKLGNEQLVKLFTSIKADADIKEDTISLEVADINRPDLWSVEGIARELKAKINKEKGIPKYKISNSLYRVIIEKKVKSVRPVIACAAVKNLRLNKEAIKQLIQLQEKLCENFGRKRKQVALGIYDFDKIKWPVKYTTVKPDAIKFTPLGMKEALTPRQILQKHEKGIQYKELLQSYKEYPLLIDSAQEVLSMPPIINSDYTGKVDEKTRNVFVEVTGYSERFVWPVLNVMVTALAERGGEIFRVKTGNLITPDLEQRKIKLDVDYCNNILGTNFSAREIARFLEKARYSTKINKKDKKEIEVSYMPYRQDILDERDVIEDIAIAYGYPNLKPVMPAIATVGKPSAITYLKEKIVSLLLGLGFQEVSTFTLTNKSNLFKKMKLKEQPVIEIENPVSEYYAIIRNKLLPSLLEFLSKNTKKLYPQCIFEISEIVKIDKNEKASTRLKLGIVITSKDANFTSVKQVLDYLSANLGTECSIKPAERVGLIEGRGGDIIIKGKKLGIIGEVHPKVLSKWKMEMPTAAIEIYFDKLFSLIE